MGIRPLVRLVGAAALSAALIGCGSGDSGQGPLQLASTHAEVCAGMVPEYTNGIAIATGCAFIQHTTNIAQFGQSAAPNSELYDASDAPLATITNTCDAWIMGTDARGITVIINQGTGVVISHGSVHPGQPATLLPDVLQLPLHLHLGAS